MNTPEFISVFWTFPVQYDDPTLDPQDREEYPVWSSGSPKQPSEYQMFYAGYNAPWYLDNFTNDTSTDSEWCVFIEALPWYQCGMTDTERWEYLTTPLATLYGNGSYHVRLGSGYYYHFIELQVAVNGQNELKIPEWASWIDLYAGWRYIYGLYEIPQ